MPEQSMSKSSATTRATATAAIASRISMTRSTANESASRLHRHVGHLSSPGGPLTHAGELALLRTYSRPHRTSFRTNSRQTGVGHRAQSARASCVGSTLDKRSEASGGTKGDEKNQTKSPPKKATRPVKHTTMHTNRDKQIVSIGLPTALPTPFDVCAHCCKTIFTRQGTLCHRCCHLHRPNTAQWADTRGAGLCPWCHRLFGASGKWRPGRGRRR